MQAECHEDFQQHPGNTHIYPPLIEYEILDKTPKPQRQTQRALSQFHHKKVWEMPNLESMHFT
jgi:hypothetical protein